MRANVRFRPLADITFCTAYVCFWPIADIKAPKMLAFNKSGAYGARMQRRELITFLDCAVAMWPLTVRAQQPQRMQRIGVLMAHADSPAGGDE